MAQFKVTVKTTSVTNGVRLEKGMSVNVVWSGGSPLTTQQGQQAIADAFTRGYGVDIKKANKISSAYLEVVQVNK